MIHPRASSRSLSFQRAGLLALVVLWATGAVRYAAGESRADELARAALGILAASGDERKARLETAARGDLDPWLLSEHLRAAGAEKGLLTRMAKLVGARAPQLAHYVARPDKKPVKREWLEALGTSETALKNGDVAKALGALKRASVPSEGTSVTAAAAMWIEARAYRAQAALERCVRSALAVGQAAGAIGWRVLAKEAYKEGLRLARAIGLLEEARECALGLLGIQEAEGDVSAVAGSFQDLAGIDFRRGDLSGALRHFDQALAIHRSLGNTAAAVDAISVRSMVYAQMGDFPRALDDVRDLSGRTTEFSTPGRLADYYSNAALVYAAFGNTAEAESLLAQSERIAAKRGDSVSEAIAIGNRGFALQADGQWDDAIAAFEQARVILESEGRAFQVAVAQLNIAEALRERAGERLRAAAAADPEARDDLRHQAMKDCGAALGLVDQGIALLGPVGAAGVVASMRETRCQVRLTCGELDGLAAEFEAVIEEARRLRKWKTQVSAAHGLVRLLVGRAAWVPAIRLAKRLADWLADGYGGIADLDVARARSGDADAIDLGVRAAAQAGRVDDLHYLMERGRAGALLRGMGGRAAALRATVPGELLQKLDIVRAAKAEAFIALSKIRLKGTLPEVRLALVAYEKARDVEAGVRVEIEAAELKEAAHLVPPSVEVLPAIRRRLQAAQRAGAPTVYLAFNLQPRDVYCLVADAGEPRIVHLGPEHTLPIQSALRRLMEERAGGYPAQTLVELRKHLVAPLGLPTGRVHYLISPDRELAFVPYGDLLPEDVSFSLVPSATTWMMLREQGLKHGKGTLGIGDPAYDRIADKDVFFRRGGSRLAPLPETRGEVEALTSGTADLRLLGMKATEDGFLRALQSRGEAWRWHCVLIACHGLVDVEWPSLSSLALTPSTTEDGYLTAGEILRLPLRTDLAVLSGCQTGRGRYVRGEGIMGLTRAFMYAGAPRVLVSLWNVDDAATSALMRAFDKHWRGGATAAWALRLAQKEIRETVVEEKGAGGKVTKSRPWKAPEYWAAWVLWGLGD